jgi:hypothetical protein
MTEHGFAVDLDVSSIVARELETIRPRSRYVDNGVDLDGYVAAASDQTVHGPTIGKSERADENDLFRSRTGLRNTIDVRRK